MRKPNLKRGIKAAKRKQPLKSGTAEMLVEGIGMNAVIASAYSKGLGEPDIGDCMAALIKQTKKVKDGDMTDAEGILVAQAVALNAMFTHLALLSSKQTVMNLIDRLARLALKAQGQCRATLETLAIIKQPPAIFARQANIAQGPQQVNNHLRGTSPAEYCDTSSRAGIRSAQNELLEAHEKPVDPTATSATGKSNQAMATVGIFHGAPNTQRQGKLGSECR
jgi:hypothetical protein